MENFFLFFYFHAITRIFIIKIRFRTNTDISRYGYDILKEITTIKTKRSFLTIKALQLANFENYQLANFENYQLANLENYQLANFELVKRQFYLTNVQLN